MSNLNRYAEQYTENSVLSAPKKLKPADLQRVLLFLPIEGTPKGYPVRFKFLMSVRAEI